MTIPTPRTLVLGGARSGKSGYAEGLLAHESRVTYVATAAARPDDDEWQERVRLHQARRPAGWITEEDADLPALLAAAEGPVLVDCMSLWLTGVLDVCACWDDPTSLGKARDRYDELLTSWSATSARTVLVSSEVGWGVVPATVSGRLFRDELGRLNAALAAAADEVVLVVAGLPLRLK
ncbi:bifunctional adenosylcobinamide kinase/adenosylcobinamide-phosphate guanylyltransferase [Acidothermaceae bacterium B102]|nr:bifunctional adenosylcobinamide kinase/adenosylcobinamide-phosphate guanylyltransferase [Acidothermaceae bacterium B102]